MVGGFMYVLACVDGSFYTGSTTHLNKRVQQHHNGEGANYTKTRLPVKLVYYEIPMSRGTPSAHNHLGIRYDK